MAEPQTEWTPGATSLPVQIRSLTASDAEALAQFFIAAGTDPEIAHYFHPHPLTRDSAGELCAQVSQSKDRYFALFVDDLIAAYAMLRGWNEGYEIPSFGVCVHPELRDSGAGQAITLHAIEIAREHGARKMRLTVYRENERAVHVYEKFGFQFTPKNDQELLGVLDLDGKIVTSGRPLNRVRLLEWHASRQRVFKIGMWCAYGITLKPVDGIGVFVYHLVDALLKLDQRIHVTLAIHAGDEMIVSEYIKRFPNQLAVISNKLTERPPEPKMVPEHPAVTHWVEFSDEVRRVAGGPIRTAKKMCHHLIGGARAVIGPSVKKMVQERQKALLLLLPLFPVLFILMWGLYALNRIARAGFDTLVFPFRLIDAQMRKRQVPPPVHIIPSQPDWLAVYPIQEAKEAGCDVWVYPYLAIPLKIDDHASVAFIHDLVFSRFPEHFHLNEVLSLEQVFRQRTKEATLNACMSKFIRENDLRGLLGLREDRVRMIRPAAPTDCLSVPGTASQDWIVQQVPRPYFLYPAGIRGYKNHALMIDALAVLRDEYQNTDFDIVFTGPEIPELPVELIRRAKNKKVSAQVRFLGKVSREELNSLYQHAVATIVPSLYEQGSFPIYESIFLNCPAACSDIPSLREQCQGFGEDMLYFDPLEASELANAMMRLSSEREYFAERQSHHARMNWFRTWANVAEEWLAVFRHAQCLFERPAPTGSRSSTRATFRIGCWLDYGGTFTPTEGIGVFTHSLLRGFMKLPESIELVLMVKFGDEEPVQGLQKRYPNRVRVVPATSQRLADQTEIARQQNCHAWILPYASFPKEWIDFPAVVMLHDYVEAHYPNGFDALFLQRTKELHDECLAKAKMVVCESQVIADTDAKEYLKVPQEKLRVIYAAPPELDLDEMPPSEAILSRLNRPFLFYPGAFRSYKNHKMLLHTMRVLREEYHEKGFDLVLTGPNVDELPEEIKLILSHGQIGSSVHILGRVSRGTIQELYRRAFALIFPTLYEGCGLPVYEAISLGCPVACSDIPILREQFALMQDSLVFFNPEQTHSIARAILKLRDEREEILRYQQELRKKVWTRTWTDVAAEWVEVLKEVAYGKVQPEMQTRQVA